MHEIFNNIFAHPAENQNEALRKSRVQTRLLVRTHGFSMVELLIAMTVGLVLISGMIAVFAGNKRSSELNSAMADIQENARFALDNIARDIRMSGFQGCVDINRGSATLLANNLPTNNYFNSAAMGSIVNEGGLWLPSPPLGFKPENHNALIGTHALTLQFGSPATFALVGQVNQGTVPSPIGPIVVNTDPDEAPEAFDMSTGDFAMISDCNNADIFRISGVNAGPKTATILHDATANVSGALTVAYGAPETLPVTDVMRFISNVYYVGDTGLVNEDGDAITALYQQSLPYGDPVGNPPTELVRGVENMRVSFGIRTSPQSLAYVVPGDPQYNPSEVESIRVGLLMNSYDRIARDDDTNTYMLAGQAITASDISGTANNDVHGSDKRFRLAFNTTVKVRNRRNLDERVQ